jgi:hypothetical protein
MSDILTNYSSCAFDDRLDNDNLVEFLTKLARFGIDQCLHFAHLIVNKQRSFDDKYQIYQDKRVILFEIYRRVFMFFRILDLFG